MLLWSAVLRHEHLAIYLFFLGRCAHTQSKKSSDTKPKVRDGTRHAGPPNRGDVRKERTSRLDVFAGMDSRTCEFAIIVATG